MSIKYYYGKEYFKSSFIVKKMKYSELGGAYFWAFIAVLFVGHLAILSNDSIENFRIIPV